MLLGNSDNGGAEGGALAGNAMSSDTICSLVSWIIDQTVSNHFQKTDPKFKISMIKKEENNRTI